jgi:DNA repair exonuclease SbcCD ATPase subunit
MGQLKDDFPERAAVASSIAASASAIRSQQSEARPLRQQASEAQQALDKNVRALNSLDSQIADTESRMAELKEKRAETATQQVQLKARYLELAAKVADLPPPPQAELQGHLSNFDSVLESGDLAAIREGWAKLKTSCQSVAQKEAAGSGAAPAASDSGGGTGGEAGVETGVPTHSDEAMPQVEAADSEAFQNFLHEWQQAQSEEVSSESRQRVSTFIEAAAKRAKTTAATPTEAPAPRTPS